MGGHSLEPRLEQAGRHVLELSDAHREGARDVRTVATRSRNREEPDRKDPRRVLNLERQVQAPTPSTIVILKRVKIVSGRQYVLD